MKALIAVISRNESHAEAVVFPDFQKKVDFSHFHSEKSQKARISPFSWEKSLKTWEKSRKIHFSKITFPSSLKAANHMARSGRP